MLAELPATRTAWLASPLILKISAWRHDARFSCQTQPASAVDCRPARHLLFSGLVRRLLQLRGFRAVCQFSIRERMAPASLWRRPHKSIGADGELPHGEPRGRAVASLSHGSGLRVALGKFVRITGKHAWKQWNVWFVSLRGDERWRFDR